MKPGIQETRDTGNKGYRKREFRTGGNGNRRDAEQGIQNAGQLGCRTVRMQDSWDVGLEGCRKGGTQDKYDVGEERFRISGLKGVGCK